MQTSPLANYQYLGQRTFFFWLFQKSRGAIFTFAIFLVVTILVNTVLPEAVFNITIPWSFVLLGIFILAFFMFLIAYMSVRFIYANNRFLLDEDALRVHRGFISEEELAIPYRQIQSVNIERSYGQQMWGVSSLIVLSAGQGFGKEGEGGEADELFSTIDSDVATWLQGELLKRTNVQKVIEAPPRVPEESFARKEMPRGPAAVETKPEESQGFGVPAEPVYPPDQRMPEGLPQQEETLQQDVSDQDTQPSSANEDAAGDTPQQ